VTRREDDYQLPSHHQRLTDEAWIRTTNLTLTLKEMMHPVLWLRLSQIYVHPLQAGGVGNFQEMSNIIWVLDENDERLSSDEGKPGDLLRGVFEDETQRSDMTARPQEEARRAAIRRSGRRKKRWWRIGSVQSEPL
ncbi:hypothetical protein AMECASPLE_001777, partial [Ameca splendens]